MKLNLKVKKLNPAATLPSYAREGDAGLDLFAVKAIVIEPGKSALVPTGIAIELPSGTEAQVRPRSGLALKHAITVLNTPGTVDEGYRGEVGVILINLGQEPFRITRGMRIAQLVVARHARAMWREAGELDRTARGAGGFGSTGVTAGSAKNA